jgi:hypothetical protein
MPQCNARYVRLQLDHATNSLSLTQLGNDSAKSSSSLGISKGTILPFFARTCALNALKSLQKVAVCS